MKADSLQTQSTQRNIAAKALLVAILGSSLAIAQAAISQVSIRPAAPVERDTVFVDVVFDAPVCTPSQSGAVAQTTSGSPATNVYQARVDGQTISVVISATQAISACTPTSMVTVALPPLSAGTYTIRVADSALGLSGIVYANRTIQTSASATVTVVPDTPPAVNVYLFANSGPVTQLSVVDAGSYQYFPYYASDVVHWQAVFYAWSRRTPEPNPQIQPVYALTSRIAGLEDRKLYTIDPKERASLLAMGAFVGGTAEAPSVAPFAVIAPTGGVCPLGRVSIYRAFDPKAIIHRYVPVATYRALLANGWKGEGIAFCGATEPEGASSWAPN